MWRTIAFLILVNFAFISIMQQYTEYDIPFIPFELPVLPFWVYIIMFVVAGILFGYERKQKK